MDLLHFTDVVEATSVGAVRLVYGAAGESFIGKLSWFVVKLPRFRKLFCALLGLSGVHHSYGKAGVP